ncbi:MAG: hypothetical protein C4324_02975 [Blastocatellia bacterium]
MAVADDSDVFPDWPLPPEHEKVESPSKTDERRAAIRKARGIECRIITGESINTPDGKVNLTNSSHTL